MGHGEAVDAAEAEAISDCSDYGEAKEDGDCQKGAMDEISRGKDHSAKTDEDSLRGECDSHGDSGLLFLPEDAEFEAARKADRQDVPDREIGERTVEQSSERGENGYQRRRRKNPTHDGPDEQSLNKAYDRKKEILPDHDVAETHGRKKKKLDTCAFKSEAIENPVHLNQERISDGNGKDKAGSRCVSKKIAALLRLADGETKNEDDNYGNNEVQQHGAAAKRVAKFLFKDSSDGARNAEDFQER